MRARSFRFAIVGGALGAAVVALLASLGSASMEGKGLWAVILGMPTSPIILVLVYVLDLVKPRGTDWDPVVAYWPYASLIINWVAIGGWWGYSTGRRKTLGADAGS